MDWATVLRGIDVALASGQDRAEQAARVAALIRQAGGYRWVGLYAVTDQEIAAVGWSGPGPPAHPRFPVTEGLSGAAVAGRGSVVVGDVTADPRYLTAFSSTRSEAVVPVVDPATGAVVGTLDVESAERDAFTEVDQRALERCAASLTSLSARRDRRHRRTPSSEDGRRSWSALRAVILRSVLLRCRRRVQLRTRCR